MDRSLGGPDPWTTVTMWDLLTLEDKWRTFAFSVSAIYQLSFIRIVALAFLPLPLWPSRSCWWNVAVISRWAAAYLTDVCVSYICFTAEIKQSNVNAYIGDGGCVNDILFLSVSSARKAIFKITRLHRHHSLISWSNVGIMQRERSLIAFHARKLDDSVTSTCLLIEILILPQVPR